MDYKSILEEFNKDLRDLQMRYLYIPLNDYLWEHLAREMNEIRDKYKVHGGIVDRFVRGVLSDMTELKEGIEYGDKRKKDQ